MEWPGLLRTNPALAVPQIRSLALLGRAITDCNACPRLVKWREEVAVTKRRAYLDEALS